MPAFHPTKLGHVNVLTQDVKRLSSFYVDELGFRLTDRLGDEGIWLHLNADHHVHAMLEKDETHFHHFALELRDIGEVRLLLDHLAKHGRWVIWGPGRHGVAASIFAYIRIPEEDLIVELYCDMEQLRAPTTSRATGRTRRIPRTRGAPCRRGRTSASTPRRSRPSAASSRPSAARLG